MAEDGWECPHCGERKAASEFDNDSLVCRSCELIAVAERQFRGDLELDELEVALDEVLPDDDGELGGGD